MAANNMRDMTVEEFDDWSAAKRREAAIAEAADEAGGPRLSLVPLPEQNEAWPTDLLPPDTSDTSDTSDNPCAEAVEPLPVAATPFDGIPLESLRKRSPGGAPSGRICS